jgi:hypothetical protein
LQEQPSAFGIAAEGCDIQPSHVVLAQFLVGQRRPPIVAQQGDIERLHGGRPLDGRRHGPPTADRGGAGVRTEHRHRTAINDFGVRAVERRHEVGRIRDESDVAVIERKPHADLHG